MTNQAGALLNVSEIFPTIQGEGTYTGIPAHFVRLFGCSVGCPWCDTKYAWLPGATPVNYPTGGGRHQVARMSVPDILMAVTGTPTHVVITGGEPLGQPLHGLVKALQDAGKYVQIETSGTAPLGTLQPHWLTVSPKLGMPGGKPLIAEVLQAADEIKMPVGRVLDIENLRLLLAGVRATGQNPRVYLQPISLSKKATALCVEAATANGWWVSLQAHKLAGLP